ncbi:hypothetical protein [Rhodothermus marinus]|uniref:hypothetical protein n=1 Tax=Rhodothermus marinus TaxID=29549 RepID=UPI0012BA3ACF|nr:hypothetical protein [Rhodothermus marinus]BBM68737.1 hypothetical protein RmaAA213_05830 [Rhodothermus marinus]BBM71716.1 hypothetical protein RmaAA338_05810 [Rhodothermus marinus]
MGQQQLLLLVLGMVIVGIAVVAGIQAFSEGRQKAATDAAVSDALRIATDLQAWAMKPEAFGGGGGDLQKGGEDVTFADLGYPEKGDGAYGYADDNIYITPNGCFELTIDNAASVQATIDAYESLDGTECGGTHYAQVKITGTDVGDVTTVVNPGSNSG